MNFLSCTLLQRTAKTLALVFFIGGLVTLGAPIVTSATSVPGPEAEKGKQARDQVLQDQWGIELTAIRITAAGHMVDFRYRVLDADKAAPLFKRQTKPYLIHQASGKVLAVPNTAKVGSLRNTNIPQQGRIYWMFFGNKGLVKAGDKVTVVIGDCKAEDLVVQ